MNTATQGQAQITFQKGSYQGGISPDWLMEMLTFLIHTRYREPAQMVRAGGEFLSTPSPKIGKHEAGARKGQMLLDGLALAIFCSATYCAAARVVCVCWCDGDFAPAIG